MEKDKYSEDKMKKLKTTEILDFCGAHDRETIDRDWEKENAYEEELAKREPFDHYKRNVEYLQKENKNLRNIINKLVNHTHDKNGTVVIPIKELNLRL